MTRESFAPEHIYDFISTACTVLNTGSYYWFNGRIDSFKPHDYDYIVLSEADEYGADKNHYMYMDCFFFSYRSDWKKDEIIEKVLEFADNILPGNIIRLIHKNFCDYFGITFNDIIVHSEKIKVHLNKLASLREKYRYYCKLFEYQIENNSFELTDKQLADIYNIFMSSKEGRDGIGLYDKKPISGSTGE